MRRLDVGGDAIDRSRVVSFTFDGRELTGSEGDTLASALLANGVDVVCRSPIQGRPRGVYSAGAEEPCAFVGVDAPFVDPVVAATTVDLVDGLIAHGVPGVGRLPDEGVPTVRSEHRHAHVETLVIGASAEGVTEANAAAARGDRSMLVESRGWLPGEVSPDVDVLARATALGVYEDGYVLIHQRSRPVERVWHVRARNVVLATGAHERPIAFADNDRPGVMLATSARTFLDRFGVVPGGRAVVFTTNHRGHDAAFALADAGVEIAAIVDVGTAGGPATDAARARGIDVRSGWAVAGTDGDPRVSAVHLVGPAGERDTVDADLLLVSGGWNPVVQLWRAIGGGLRYDEPRACFVPDGTGPSWLSVVGAAAGDVPDVGAVLVRAGRRLLAPLRGHAARPDRGRRAGRRGARPPLGRARQARDVHRDGAGSGTDVGRADGRDREPGARRRTRTRRVRRTPARRTRRSRSRRSRAPTAVTCSIRCASTPIHAVARRTRRGVRERRAVEAAVVLPGRRVRGDGDRGPPRGRWRCAPASA